MLKHGGGAGATWSSQRIWLKGWMLALLMVLLSVGCKGDSDSPPPPTPVPAASLQSLQTSPGALSPSFDPATLAYTVTVPPTASSVQVTATVPDPSLTLTINQQAATSGQPVTIPMPNPTATVSVVVTAPGGSTSTTTVNVSKQITADLLQLSVSAGALTPAFAPATTQYTVTTGFGTTNTTVTATVTDPTATLSINGQAARSGQAAGPFPLQVGTTQVSVVVTASNNSKKTYQVAITRQGTTQLANLQTSAGPIAPTFDPTKLAYTASVPFPTTQATITMTLADSTATVTINNQAARSGQAAGPFALNVGDNVFTILVQSTTEPSTTYTLTITRRPPSTNARLSDVTVTPPGGTVNGFDPGNVGPYTITVGANAASVNVTATKSNPTSTMTGAVSAPAGQPTGQATVKLGAAGSTTPIVIKVVAEDGTTTNTYTVNVIRTACHTTLASLALSAGALQFDPNTTTYKVTVPFATITTTVTATLADTSSTLTINGQGVTSGQAFGPIALNEGTNTITLVVTCADGVTKTTYTITVTRRPADGDSSLSNLSTDIGTLNQIFRPAILTYTVAFDCNISETGCPANALVTAVVASSSSTLKINGVDAISGSPSTVTLTPPDNCSETPGTTVVPIDVTAQNGSKTTYKLTVELTACFGF